MVPRAEGSNLYRLAWPATLTVALFSLLETGEAALLGLVGVGDLAGAGLGAAIACAALGFPIGMVAALSPLIAGQGAQPAPAVLGSTLRLALLAALALGTLAMGLAFAALPLIPRLGLDPGLAAAAHGYLLWRAPALLPEVLFVAGWALLEGLGRTRAVLGAGLLNAVAVCGFDLLLVPGWDSVPQLGARGVALASGLATLPGLLGVAWPLIRLYRRTPGTAASLAPSDAGRWAAGRVLHPTTTRPFLRLGLPLGLTALLGLLDGLLIATLLGRIGTLAAAGHDLLGRTIHLGSTLAQGLGVALLVLVARATSRRDTRAVLRHAGRTLRLQLVLGAALAGLLLLGGPAWLSLLTNDAGLRAVASSTLPWAAAILFAEGLMVLLTRLAEGLGKGRLVLRATVLCDLLLGGTLAVVLGTRYGLAGCCAAWLIKDGVKVVYLAGRLLPARPLLLAGQALVAIARRLVPAPGPSWVPALAAVGRVPVVAVPTRLAGRLPARPGRTLLQAVDSPGASRPTAQRGLRDLIGHAAAAPLLWRLLPEPVH